jgi:hypothetical protein
MLHFHFKLSNHLAHDAEGPKSELEALESKALASTKEAEIEYMAEMEDKPKTEDTQDNTRWCCSDRNTDLDSPERRVKQKLSTAAGTLFIPRLSIKLHLKAWNNFYS